MARGQFQNESDFGGKKKKHRKASKGREGLNPALCGMDIEGK